jgi:ferritin-like protein
LEEAGRIMKFTYGKNPAAVTLAELVKDNPSARRKVMRIVSRYTQQLLQLTGAKDPETVTLCMGLLKDYTLKRVDDLKVDEKVRSYARNVVVSRYRVFLHEFNVLVPLIRKKIQEDKERKAQIDLLHKSK